MRLYCYDDYRIGVATSSGRLKDLTGLVSDAAPLDRMTALIERWDRVGHAVAQAASEDGETEISTVKLLPPQPRPGRIVAAPVNYVRHQQEMGGKTGVYREQTIHTIETYGGIMKASGSVIGPSDAIRLPAALDGRRFDHEAEVGFIIGRQARDVSKDDALQYVFGYFPLMDITLRGDEDRSFRKSFETFTPIGPAIVTADEIVDPETIEFELTVNGEVRQSATTADLIFGVARLVEYYSTFFTLEPGDIIASGTPEGVGPIEAGDSVSLTLKDLGTLTLGVTS